MYPAQRSSIPKHQIPISRAPIVTSTLTEVVSQPTDTMDFMDVHVKSVLGGTVTVSCPRSCSSEGLRIAIADQFNVEPDSIELTARGFSTDSTEGLAAVHSGCTVNLIPATRSGLDTTLHGGSRAVTQEDICGLLEFLESSGDSINAKVTIVFSGDDGTVGETHLDASEAATFIKASLAGDRDADIAMETLLGRAGDTGLADDKDPAAFGVSSPDTSPAADPESDCKTGPDPDDVSRSSSTPSSPLQQNKRKSDDRRGSVGESPDDVTDAGSRSLAERRARRHEECRAKTKEMETRKMENLRMNRTLEMISQKKRARAAKRARRLGLLKAKNGSGTPIVTNPLAAVPRGIPVPVAAEAKREFGGFQKGFLC